MVIEIGILRATGTEEAANVGSPIGEPGDGEVKACHNLPFVLIPRAAYIARPVLAPYRCCPANADRVRMKTRLSDVTER